MTEEKEVKKENLEQKDIPDQSPIGDRVDALERIVDHIAAFLSKHKMTLGEDFKND